MRASNEPKAWPGKSTRLVVSGLAALVLCFNGQAQNPTYTVLHDFAGSDGQRPRAGLLLNGTTLYGTTAGGGNPGAGTLFRMNTDGTGFVVLRQFGWADGINPQPGLILDGMKLYGTTQGQSGWWYGSIFSMNTNGTDFRLLKTFDGIEGDRPSSLLLYGGNLYGTTMYGGSSNRGTIFKLGTDGSGWKVLKQFTMDNGGMPDGGLMMYAGTLYGTTLNGGELCCGTVFKFEADGSGFALVKSFGGPETFSATNPKGDLAVSGSSLYGCLLNGPADHQSMIYKIQADGSQFTPLYVFTGAADGWVPAGGLALRDDTLYGTTWCGGITNQDFPNGAGTVFKVNTDGTGFRVLKRFTGGLDGAIPQEGRLAVSGTTVYGATRDGGTLNLGVVFSIAQSEPPVILNPPNSQTAEVGSTVLLSVRVAESSSLSYQWLFNGDPLTDATNFTLRLREAQYANGGSYTVVVSNASGAVTSAAAMLNVIPPVQRRSVAALSLVGRPGGSLHIECRDSLGSAEEWLALDTVTLTNVSQIYLDLTMSPKSRLYRTRLADAMVPPYLDLHMVPAITLSGATGQSVRLDYINTYGPIDAWRPLITVTLTNQSQLYFDFSSIGQPQRLYRLIQIP